MHFLRGSLTPALHPLKFILAATWSCSLLLIANSESDRILGLVFAMSGHHPHHFPPTVLSPASCKPISITESGVNSVRYTKNLRREKIKGTSCERKFARSFEITAAGNSICLEGPEERGALRPRGFAAASSGLRNLLPQERCGDSVLFFRARLSVSNHL